VLVLQGSDTKAFLSSSAGHAAQMTHPELLAKALTPRSSRDAPGVNVMDPRKPVRGRA